MRSRLHEGIGMHFFKVVLMNSLGCLPQQGFVFVFTERSARRSEADATRASSEMYKMDKRHSLVIEAY